MESRDLEPGLVERLQALTDAVRDLSERTALAETLEERQVALGASVRFQRWLLVVLAAAALVAVVAIANVTAHRTAAIATEIQCQALNDSNAANAGFWRSTLNRLRTPPPGPDATPAEVAAYEASQERLHLFLDSVDELAEPRPC